MIAKWEAFKTRMTRMFAEPSTYAGIGTMIASYSVLRFPFDLMGYVLGLVAMVLKEGKPDA